MTADGHVIHAGGGEDRGQQRERNHGDRQESGRDEEARGRGRGRGTRAARRGRRFGKRPLMRRPPWPVVGQVPLLLVDRRPPDVLDEDLLQDRLGDLEARDALAAVERGAQDRLRIGAGRHAPARRSPRAGPSRRTPASSVEPIGAVAIAIGRQRTTCRPIARFTSRTGPLTTTLPASMIAIDSHSSSTVSIWCVLKISVLPRSRISRNASLRSWTLTGSSPVKGSSMISTAGSWRIAAMNWIFCWLPFESSSTLRSR